MCKIATLVALLAGLATPPAPGQDRPPRPNVVLIIADDMAWDDCGAFGNRSIRTPNIDRLAREGVRFDRAFLTTSSCSPSRSSLLTGRYPHAADAEELHWPLPAAHVGLPEKLRGAGYWAAAAGKWHLGDPAKSRFDLVREGYKYIRNDADRPQTPPADAVRSPTFAALRRLRDEGRLPPAQWSSFHAPRPIGELYDLDVDPHELVNLAGDPGSAGVLASMRRALEDWGRETDDARPARPSPDEFDRETGDPLPNRARPRAGKRTSKDPSP